MPCNENKAECDNGEELKKALTPLSTDSTKGKNLKGEPSFSPTRDNVKVVETLPDQ